MVDIEATQLILTTSDRLMSRTLSDDIDMWQLSDPLPSTRTVSVCEVSHRQWIVLALSEDGKYQLLHTLDLIRSTLVHTHDTEIFGVFRLGHGKAVFCAADGWWMTLDSGMTWEQIALTGPIARSLVIVKKLSTLVLFAYDINDRKVYRCEHSMSEFLEPMAWEAVYSASMYARWYPAIAGGPLAIVVGDGTNIIRTQDLGENWETVATMDSAVKSVTISDHSVGPAFLIEAEGKSDILISQFYWSYDLCDSLVPDINRSDVIVDVKTVIPTGASNDQRTFAIIGRNPRSQAECRIIEMGE